MLIRVVLDTGVVRNAIQGDEFHRALGVQTQNTDDVRFSLADSSMYELIAALVEGRILWDEWGRFRETMPTLCSRWPILPGGKELAKVAGLIDVPSVEPEYERRLLCTQWSHMLACGSLDELRNPSRTFVDPLGKRVALAFNEEAVAEIGQSSRSTWIDFVRTNSQKVFHEDGTRKSVDEIVAEFNSASNVLENESPDFARRVEACHRLQADFLLQAANENTPYDPTTRRRRGDVFDLSLLHYVSLPAMICTTDRSFVNRLRSTSSLDANQVVLVDELLEVLRRDSLRERITAHQTPEIQHALWKERAYFNWIDRGRPLFDSETDWYDSEPIA